MDAQTIRQDVGAALAVTLLGIPQAVAYAMIAGLPPAMGLYASALPAIVSSLTRSSSHVVAGPTNALSLLVGGVIAAGTLEIDPMLLGTTLALMVGLVQAGAGVLRLGAVVDYISRAVVLGYITGAGALIGLGQLGNLTGTSMGKGGPLTRFTNWLGTLGDAHPATVALGVGTVAMLVGLRLYNRKLPGAVIVMGLGILLSWGLGLSELGVKVVADVAPIQTGLPPLTLPETDPEMLEKLLPIAMAGAVLSLVESSSVGRSIASRTGERLNMSWEFIGQGLANVAAGLFGGYPTSGSLSRSALNHSAGAVSRMSGLYSGVFVILVLLVASPIVNLTPIACLAGLLLVVAYDLIDAVAIRYVMRSPWGDRLAFVATLVGTWTLSLDKAIYIGVAISVILFLRNVSNLNVRELTIVNGRIREAEYGPQNRLSKHLRAIHVEGSLFFGAANELSDALEEVLQDRDAKAVVVRLKRARGLDFTTAGVLVAAHERMVSEGRHLFLVGMTPGMMEVLGRVGIVDVFDDDEIFPTEEQWFVAMDRALLHARELVGDIGASDEVDAYLGEREGRAVFQSVATPA
ncbi:MAG: SulP family inorganic anion transporter [Deltaproteobacteria bacterium]|nr:MAG: SulP family inorganic anion transporter [Deltaproteobacteria bacterium]